MRAAVPLMLDGGGGAIVNNASVSGLTPTRNEAAYSAAKAGVIALTKSGALEYGPTVRVNCVAPGYVRTPLTAMFDQYPDAFAEIADGMPAGRMGEPEEIAEVILFLACGRSSYITGQTIVVDGGVSLPQAGTDAALAKLFDLLTRRPERASGRSESGTRTAASKGGRSTLSDGCSDGFEQLAGADVGRRVPQLRHRPGLDLADPLPGEAEVLGHFLERALAGAVEAEAEREDRLLAVVEHGEHLGDLAGQQRRGRVVERRDRVAVLDEVAELGVAVVTDGLVERDRVDRVAEHLDDLLERQLGFAGQLGQRRRAAHACPRAGRAA